MGQRVLRALQALGSVGEVRAGVRDVAKDAAQLREYPVARPVRFDFEDPDTLGPALSGVDRLFLLRPPQLADVEKDFLPLLAAARAGGVRHVVFLSVQGAGEHTIVPHHKIEGALRASGLAYTFLRPAYFMQNFSTTLRDDLVQRDRIFVPASDAKFTLVDVRDIGRVAAVVLQSADRHVGRAYPLTSAVPLAFGEMAVLLTQALGRSIRYESPNPLRFFWVKKKQGLATPLILVMIALHVVQRFVKTPPTTGCVRELTGQEPHTFTEYARDYRAALRHEGKAQV